jgi:DNA invertase Pin-like site-specific DNA recombinase
MAVTCDLNGVGETSDEAIRSTRAVVYARFSSELQRDESIEDQVEVCRREAERQSWTASRFRPQYQQMIAEADQKQFDVLVCEALDRLGRQAGLYCQLQCS